MTNPYFRDCKYFFRCAARLISTSMNTQDLLIATTAFAFAMERVLKGILFDINPLYVLENPEYKNSIAVVYKSRIKHSTREIQPDPNHRVITFRKSLLMAEGVSNFVQMNKTLLFFLSECRDVVAHNDLENLDHPKIQEMLLRDFYPVGKNVADRIGLDIHSLLDGQDNRLAMMSAERQESVEQRMKILLENHKNKWKVLKRHKGFTSSKDAVTDEILGTENKFEVVCPACEQRAVLYAKPEIEFNPQIQSPEIIGYFVKRLKCQFCKLDVTDFDDIAYLDTEFGLTRNIHVDALFEELMSLE